MVDAKWIWAWVFCVIVLAVDLGFDNMDTDRRKKRFTYSLAFLGGMIGNIAYRMTKWTLSILIGPIATIVSVFVIAIIIYAARLMIKEAKKDGK